ncbi:IucA/IucC family C-terminal-domain containing protein [Shouchella hunanensis]|uniref:IucA/IucC family C-terminal-domain containing protein n=1 Tax=Shouchella hunanensis TaxID=766894 RepID=A0ABY7W7K9_9BACI|nr:IucA/IucC family C-terminal-domain containing protein [Shouchella hunanensis]WDF04922.1 IucA/IucC family C-terminal-domain containing protein [Shouchella hunanensis]
MDTTQLDEYHTFFINKEQPNEQHRRLSYLVEEAGCRSFLESYMASCGALDLKIAASLFLKHYARIVAASTLYHLASADAVLRLPPDQMYISENGRQLSIPHADELWLAIPNDNRTTMRQTLLSELFADHLTPLLMTIKQVSSAPYNILWENVAVRINSIYRKMLSKDISPIVRQRIIDDFTFLQQADGALFACKKNPIHSFLYLHNPDVEAPKRRTCCFNYKVGKMEYCEACPHLKLV